MQGAKGTIRSSSERLIQDQAMLEAQLRESAFFTLTGVHKNDLTYRRVCDQLNAVIFQREMAGHAEYYVNMRIRALEWELPDDRQSTGTGDFDSSGSVHTQEPLGELGGAGGH